MQQDQRTLVFLTGATGTMGGETMRQLLARRERFRVRILVLPKERDLPAVKAWRRDPDVEVLLGDLTCYDDVRAGVSGASHVLHVGGMVSPLADRFPELTMKVNVGGAENIVRAIQDGPEPDEVRLVYIGTVAQTGCRMPPVHWGRTGDPIKISRYDQYAVSKTQAEAIVAESGLKHWVSIRQTGMAHTEMWRIFDPIMFHNPVNGVFEWSTARDSGRLMANLCEADVPQTLWRGFYNMGGGESARVVNHEFMVKTFSALGISDYRRVLRPNWFATRNFHGQWYSDSDHLEALVPYRSQTIDMFVDELARAIPWAVKAAAGTFPSAVGKRIRKLAEAPGGSLHWLANDDEAHITAYFGSREEYDDIPSDWRQFTLAAPSRAPRLLDHGYDEARSIETWTIADMARAADFRGGACLSDVIEGPFAPLDWRCAQDHHFRMTPNLMLRGGHWCPTCMVDPESYDAVAQANPYFAQVHAPRPA
ncbi:epimerase [Sphingomonas sp. DBB INV C78]|uniref:NAD-dependent epimerase/dehydratase family protein n=1 Tax=Sphingomonas sp. DBB INV C78 TaxID=3349434 RepID=UPI0036D420E8